MLTKTARTTAFLVTWIPAGSGAPILRSTDPRVVQAISAKAAIAKVQLEEVAAGNVRRGGEYHAETLKWAKKFAVCRADATQGELDATAVWVKHLAAVEGTY